MNSFRVPNFYSSPYMTEKRPWHPAPCGFPISIHSRHTTGKSSPQVGHAQVDISIRSRHTTGKWQQVPHHFYSFQFAREVCRFHVDISFISIPSRRMTGNHPAILFLLQISIHSRYMTGKMCQMSIE
jgi:hypothetical protein